MLSYVREGIRTDFVVIGPKFACHTHYWEEKMLLTGAFKDGQLAIQIYICASDLPGSKTVKKRKEKKSAFWEAELLETWREVEWSTKKEWGIYSLFANNNMRGREWHAGWIKIMMGIRWWKGVFVRSSAEQRTSSFNWRSQRSLQKLLADNGF